MSIPRQNDIEPPIQRVFPVGPDEDCERKCGYCGFRAVSRYLLAVNESHAEALRKQMADDPSDNGMCGACLAGYIAGEGFRLTRAGDARLSAAGISLPAFGLEVNSDLPPAGEPYNHDAFEPRMERCPIEGCNGQLERVNVVADSGDGGEPADHLETIEVSCPVCRRVLFKSESAVYDRPDDDYSNPG